MLYKNLDTFFSNLPVLTLSDDRKELLNGFADYLKAKNIMGEPIMLNFICTHNSRRSHLSQVIFQALASKYNLKNVDCYSGGTEATALFPVAAETLTKIGFQISKLSETQNPVYAIRYNLNSHPIIGFSKKFDDNFNPAGGFTAIMTCSQADEDCPYVPGAERRFPIGFEDPKAFDGTPEQNEKYLERATQIAQEFNYVFKQLRKK